MIYWPGVQSSSSIKICARSDVDDTLVTCTLAGQTPQAITSDHDVMDGVVVFEFTGLTRDTGYAWTITSPADDTVTGMTRTFPTNGAVRIAVYSCQGEGDLHIARAIAREQPHLVILTGDETYQENFTLDTLSTALTQDPHYELIREARDQPLKRWLWKQGCGFAYVIDDHDWGLNDVMDDLDDAKTKYANTRLPGNGFDTMDQADWDNIKTLAANAVTAYSQGNPTNTDPEAETDAYYFRIEAGDCEVFVLSQVLSSPTRMRPKNGNVSMNGASQEAWIKARLAASTKPFKCMAIPKNALQNRQGNPDGWKAYNDVYALMDWVSSNVRGVFWVGGDFHSAGMFATKAGTPEGTQYSSLQLRDASLTEYDFDCLAFCASSASRYSPNTNAQSGQIRCDVRDSDNANEGPLDCALFYCTTRNGRVGTSKTVRRLIGFALVDVSSSILTTVKIINQVSDTITQASIRAGTNTIWEGDMPITKGYIGLHVDDSRIVSAIDDVSIPLNKCKSWSRDIAEAYTADSGDYIDQVGAVLTTTTGDQKRAHMGIYKTTGPTSSSPKDQDFVDAGIITVPGLQTKVTLTQDVNIPLESGVSYTVTGASPDGTALQFGTASDDFPSKSSTTADHVSAGPTFPDPWTQTGFTADVTYIMWARVMNPGAQDNGRSNRRRPAGNFVSDGMSMKIISASDIVLGQIVVLGNSLWVARESFSAGDLGELGTRGVYMARKESSEVIAAGESLIWDISAEEFLASDATAEAGDISGAAAVAFESAGDGTTSLRVYFTGAPGTIEAGP